jgi:hypothetical protein
LERDLRDGSPAVIKISKHGYALFSIPAANEPWSSVGGFHQLIIRLRGKSIIGWNSARNAAAFHPSIALSRRLGCNMPREAGYKILETGQF